MIEADSEGLDGSGAKPDQVYRWLRQQVVDGALHPKDRINADSLSRRLAVSKVPIREAIARLAAEGVVQILPNSGAVVAPLSWSELRDIQQARLILEPPAAAAARATEAGVGALTRTIAELRRWAKRRDGDPFEMNRRFHVTLVSLSGNVVVADLVNQVLRRVSRYRVIVPQTPQAAIETADEHEQIVQALSNGQRARLRTLLTAHLGAEHGISADARTADPRYFMTED